STGDEPDPRLLTAHEQTIRSLSDRLVAAQRPIRVLAAIHWPAAVETAFFAAGARELPPVTPETYASSPLPFDPAEKTGELLGIERDTDARLGRHPAGDFLRRRSQEYRQVVALLTARGTPEFAALARRLYPTPSN